MFLISMIYQIFVKSFSNLCQIFVKSKSFSRECYFLQWFFENIHHLPFVEERRRNCVPFGNTLTNLPFSRMDLKRYFWFYITNWSHYYVYINTQWIEANIIFPGILQRFGGWLLRNRACLIVSQNHTLQHFFFIPKIECDGFGAISNDLRSLTFFEIPHSFWDPSHF